MSLLRTLAAEVAKVGETPNFITAMAHMWFACSVMLPPPPPVYSPPPPPPGFLAWLGEYLRYHG